jgi:hypothetical protein
MYEQVYRKWALEGLLMYSFPPRRPDRPQSHKHHNKLVVWQWVNEHKNLMLCRWKWKSTEKKCSVRSSSCNDHVLLDIFHSSKECLHESTAPQREHLGCTAIFRWRSAVGRDCMARHQRKTLSFESTWTFHILVQFQASSLEFELLVLPSSQSSLLCFVAINIL